MLFIYKPYYILAIEFVFINSPQSFYQAVIHNYKYAELLL